jgi:hypothetical protein
VHVNAHENLHSTTPTSWCGVWPTLVQYRSSDVRARKIRMQDSGQRANWPFITQVQKWLHRIRACHSSLQKKNLVDIPGVVRAGADWGDGGRGCVGPVLSCMRRTPTGFPRWDAHALSASWYWEGRERGEWRRRGGEGSGVKEPACHCCEEGAHRSRQPSRRTGGRIALNLFFNVLPFLSSPFFFHFQEGGRGIL